MSWLAIFDAPALMSFCESAQAGFPRFPSDTYSNLGPLLAGIYVWRHAVTHARPDLASIGQAGVILGISSAVFHGFGTRFGEILDFAAMVLWIAVLFFHSARRAPNALQPHALVTALCLGGVTLVLSLMWPSVGLAAFTAMALFVTWYEMHVMRVHGYRLTDSWALLAVFVVMGVALMAWLLDYHHIVCDPDNHILSLHAVWHWLNSLPFLLMYRHFRHFTLGV